MANILIGSSNITRHYTPENHGTFREYHSVKCTSAGAFRAQMIGLDNTSSSVLISVIENILADHVGQSDQMEAKIDECVKGFIELVTATAERLPGTKFGLVQPLGRPALGWFHARVDDITNFLEETLQHAIEKKKLTNVAKIESVKKISQQFEPDQIHLTKPSAKIFLDVVLGNAEKFFGDEVIDVEEGEVIDVKRLEKRLEAIENELKLQKKTNRSNNLTFARIREEVDATSNKAKEDRVIINGLTSKTPIPTEIRPRIEMLKKLAKDLFELLIPNFEGKIMFVSQGKVQDTALPIIEVKLDNPENAARIRKAFAEKRRKNELPAEQKNLFITNVSTLATRVRIDVLKAIARKLSTDKEMAYVSGFVSRPMMHIKKMPVTQTSKPLKSFSFIDSVAKYGDLVADEDLSSAYFRAGRAFDGQLEQNFVLLNGAGQTKYKAGSLPDTTRAPTGNKWGTAAGTSKGSSERGRSGGYRGQGVKRYGEDLGGTSYKSKKH